LQQNSKSAQARGSTGIEKLVDIQRYPIMDMKSGGYAALIRTIQDQLNRTGCAVIEGFICSQARARMAQEVLSVAHQAYDRVERVNVYNTDVDSDYPADHPASIEMKRGNAFVARDLIPRDAIIAKLYSSRIFQDFIARCFGIERIYELADPYAGLVINVLRPGFAHPWHFDTNEFTVSLMTKSPQSGGVFEYSPNIRSQKSENLDDVRDVMTGAVPDRVRQLCLKPGDLQLFKGRYSLHRVTEVEGVEERHCSIFAYSEKPGVIGKPERTRQLFGRVDGLHLSTQSNPVRTDQLLD